MNKHECAPENASKFKDWLTNRGGLLVWKSVNLSNPVASWTTPALTENGQPYTKPTWQVEDKPAQHITSAADVCVIIPREVKRFRVAVRRSGFALKVTDAGSRKIREHVDKAGKDAYYTFDYETQECVILVADKSIPLAEYTTQV